MNGKIIGAGLYDAKIKLADGTEYDVFAVKSMSSSPDTTNVEIEGDDVKLGVFNFSSALEINLQMDGISFDALQALTGNSVTNVTASTMDLPIGTSAESNPPVFELRGYTRAKDTNNTKGKFVMVFHACQIQGIPEITQEFQSSLSVQCTIKAYPTDKTITGASLSSTRIATLKIADENVNI
jgi:hypothetical protein